MAMALTLPASVVVIIRRCTSETRCSGNSTTRSTCWRPAKASTAAPPVSPDVATMMVRRSPRPELHRDVFEGECRAMEQFERKGADVELRQGRDGWVTKRAIGLACHAREIGFDDGIVHKRADHLDRNFGIGPAGEGRNRLGRQPGPAFLGNVRHIEAAVTGKTRKHDLGKAG